MKPFLEKLKVATVAQSSQQQPVAYDADTGVKLIVIEAYGTLGDKPALHRANIWIILQQ